MSDTAELPLPEVPDTAAPVGPVSREIWLDGLWRQNPALVQLLGLCPLLAVSNNLINGLGLGVVTIFTLLVSNTLVSVLRHVLHEPIRIPMYVVVIAGVVTAIELLMQAWLPALFRSLGLFLPLIVTNCVIMARAEAFARRQRPGAAALDALAMGSGFALVLVSLGALRELIGRGTLLSGFGPEPLRVFAAESGMVLAILPPGAFLLLGLFLALRNFIDNR